jgi:hypothetical protein
MAGRSGVNRRAAYVPPMATGVGKIARPRTFATINRTRLFMKFEENADREEGRSKHSTSGIPKRDEKSMHSVTSMSPAWQREIISLISHQGRVTLGPIVCIHGGDKKGE